MDGNNMTGNVLYGCGVAAWVVAVIVWNATPATPLWYAVPIVIAVVGLCLMGVGKIVNNNNKRRSSYTPPTNARSESFGGVGYQSTTANAQPQPNGGLEGAIGLVNPVGSNAAGFCGGCGTQLGAGDLFCPSCGWRVEAQAPAQAQAQATTVAIDGIMHPAPVGGGHQPTSASKTPDTWPR